MTVTLLIPGAKASLRFEDGTSIALGNLRAWARTLTQPAEDLELILTELVSNAREHGIAGPITVSVEQSDQSVIVVVANPIPMAAASVSVDAEPSRVTSIRGRGLHLASVISDHLTIEQCEGTLTITAQLPLA